MEHSPFSNVRWNAVCLTHSNPDTLGQKNVSQLVRCGVNQGLKSIKIWHIYGAVGIVLLSRCPLIGGLHCNRSLSSYLFPLPFYSEAMGREMVLSELPW